MKEWPWQKWVAKLTEFVIGVGGLIWALVEKEPAGWYLVGSAAVIAFVEWIMRFFPPAE